MDTALSILASLLLGMGCFFSLTGGVGILRMPDFYSRLHPAGKTDTLCVMLVISGLLVQCVQYDYDPLVAAKLLLIAAFIFITAPTATHAITQAAWHDGLKPWSRKEIPSDV